MKINQLHKLFLDCNGVSTDTRKITKDSIFFALKGKNFNGNAFADNAIKKGAKYAVVDEKPYAVNDSYILVDDVLKTLQQLATYHRQYLGLKIIALTGSNGKTTTKELINAVLFKSYQTVATKGNLNNHIGVPLTLLSMNKTTEIGIIEMGANHQKEIEFLCSIALPNYGYITNFGKAHLEGFGGVEGVIKGKSELYEFLIESDGYIFFNADDTIQNKKLKNYSRIFGFSQNDISNYTISFLEAAPFVNLDFQGYKITSNLIGNYNFPNICAAIMIGSYFNVEVDTIRQAVEGYIPSNNRSQIIEKDTNTIILDAYNANPTSMIAALENFSSLKRKHKIAILGDMFELGKDAEKEHQDIAEIACDSDIDNIYLVGENFNTVDIKNKNVKQFLSFEAIKVYFKDQKFKNTSFLIKGSRGMALERIVELL